jgi:molybdenum cofactor synthesis domain-containing protein
MNGETTAPTAAVLVIGNEILSGRTQDVNINAIAKKLGAIGIPVGEARIVADIESEIVAALNNLRARYTYVFTTGGIGPTHDDITVDAVAAAFGVKVIEHPEARALLTRYYGTEKLTPARLRMARVPEGAHLIDNPVSTAPGIKIANVYVMAGVPDIRQAMLDSVIVTLRHGPKIYSRTVSAFIAESAIAEELGTVAKKFSHIDIGSYPWVNQGKLGTALVARGTDPKAVQTAIDEIAALIKAKGIDFTLSEG